MNKEICPECSKSHYSVGSSTTTLMSYTPVYKDGVLLNKNPNVSSTELHCEECGHRWIIH